MPPDLAIRPLSPKDAARVQQFVRALSTRTRAERSFSPIRELTPAQLARLTLPRGAHDLSLGAFSDGRLLAVAECVEGEFAVVVADDWQGSGLGQALMERLVVHAEGRGLPSLYGLVRAGNRAMLRLARRLGFDIARDEDPALLRVQRGLAHA